MLKKIKKILISLCVICLLFTSMPIKSYGFDGGKLFDPISSLLTAVGDAIINIMQGIFLPNEENDAVIYEGDTVSSFIDWVYNSPITGVIASKVTDGFSPINEWLGFEVTNSEEAKEYARTFAVHGFANIKYGPATIFSGNIDLFNINLLYADQNEKEFISSSDAGETLENIISEGKIDNTGKDSEKEDIQKNVEKEIDKIIEKYRSRCI